MTCAIYCRLSKEDMALGLRQESESIQNQKNLLVHHAVQQQWEIYGIYCDDDCSGADRERPQWGAMLRDAQAGRFQIVLCKTQSRFTRDMEMVEKYIHGLFPLWGIRFVALLDNVDTSIKGNKKARQINGLVNEWYLEDLSENVRAVLDQKRRAGKFIGSFPTYGYTKDPLDRNHLLVDEDAAGIVRRIYTAYLGGAGTQRIADRLNREGIPTPSRYKQAKGRNCANGGAGQSPGLWNHTTVSRILRNEMYTGVMVQGTKRKAGYKSKKLLSLPAEQWYRVEGTHRAIIDRDTFDAVQRRMDAHTRTDGSGQVHLLAGKVRCADCGGTMRRLTHTYKGVPKSYLQCGLYSTTRKAPQCTGHTIRLDRLTPIIEERIRVLLASLDEAALDGSVLLPEGDVDRPAERLRREVEAQRRQEARLREGMKTLYLDKAEGLIDRDYFARMNAVLAADLEETARRIASLEAQSRELAARAESAPAPREQIAALLTGRPVSRTLIDLLIDRITIGEKSGAPARQSITIHWKI
ncbi:recombinase family protein [Ruminococcaceae bacterium OttesenSCG-928-L11]|nr:recombinase family protein [Ruminococcaceae bacterium OttesenSCG-928-L11]